MALRSYWSLVLVFLVKLATVVASHVAPAAVAAVIVDEAERTAVWAAAAAATVAVAAAAAVVVDGVMESASAGSYSKSAGAEAAVVVVVVAAVVASLIVDERILTGEIAVLAATGVMAAVKRAGAVRLAELAFDLAVNVANSTAYCVH